MGEPVHTDYCIDGFWDAGEFIESNREHCHLLGGWIRGKDTCALWDELTKYCQTDNERRFLKAYLNLVKGRNFPMLLPQMRVGIAERRRPDFVVFVPMQYLVYKRYAIELDGGHGPERTEQDEARALDLAAENYEVISLRPGYFREVQKLVERIEIEMTEAERDARWELATSVDNDSFQLPSPAITDEDIPF
jgi:hypothetical protein